MRRFLNRFRRLHWKLMLTYTLVSIVAIEIVAIGLNLWIVTVSLPDVLRDRTWTLARQVSPLFLHTSPDEETAYAWLQMQKGDLEKNLIDLQHGFLLVTDARGQVIAAAGGEALHPGTILSNQLSLRFATLLEHTLTETGKGEALRGQEGDTLIGIAPILSPERKVQGALLIQTTHSTTQQIVLGIIVRILPNVQISILLAVIAGPVAGWITAQSFIQRFKKLVTTVDQWSQGDFSASACDASADEMSHFIHQLNLMAKQLQQLLQTRQKLAMLEERNRLARDLHDSIKQQAFAIAMQIGASRLYLEQDNEKARKHLYEADRLVHQAQEDLATIIQELRPSLLEEKSLPDALEAYAQTWSRQNDIAVSLEIQEIPELPWKVAEALLRITQEALSNVRRHSRATSARLRLFANQNIVQLSLSDNGIGFQPETASKPGIGLCSIQERLEHLGGTVTIQSEQGQGTSITARYALSSIPLE